MTRSVLFINQHYHPDFAATGQLLKDLAEDLAAKGFVVTVLSGPPLYSREKAPHREMVAGVRVVRMHSLALRSLRLPAKLLNWLSFYVLVFFYGLFLRRHDVVMALTTPPYIGFVGWFIAKVKRSKFVLNVQDLYPEVLGAAKVKASFLAPFFVPFSRLLYKLSDKIVVIGDVMADKILSKNPGLHESRFAMIENWANGTEIWMVDPVENHYKPKWGITDEFVILYSGNMGRAHNFDVVYELMRRYRDEEKVLFLFIGGGPKERNIRFFCRTNGIKNVQFHAYVPRSDLAYTYSLGDIAIITMEEGTEGLVVPSKFYAYAAAGLPVLCLSAQETDLRRHIREPWGRITRDADDAFRFIEEIRQSAYKHHDDIRRYFEENLDRPLRTTQYRDLFAGL